MSRDLVTLVTPQTEFEANIIAIVLRDNGIEAFVFSMPQAGMGVNLSGGLSGVPVQVKQEDAEMAKQVLLENKRHSIDIDWDELENGFTENTSPYQSKGMPVLAMIAFFCVLITLLSGLGVAILQLLN